jgi:predicted PurR-regulated permease PerM
VDKSVSSLPAWFQKWGIGAWLVVGMVLVVAGGVWLLERTSSIVDPLIAGFVLAAVTGVAVDKLEHQGLPRAAGAGLVLLGLIALAVLIVGLVLAGISSQGSHIDTLLSEAVDKIRVWGQDLNISASSDAANEIKKAAPDVARTLLKGVAGGVAGIGSLLVFVGFTAFTSFFLIKDGPTIGRWIERHMGVQPPEARVVISGVIHALRGYFLGLTIVGAFNAAIVTAGALILGVPMPGTIAIVTFFGSYVPIVGAWVAGIFVFALALADGGTTSALIMALIVFLANGPFQQVIQPIVFGATLRLNPLVVFTVTIAAGTLFGMVGLVLAAPLVSAAVRIHDDLVSLRAPLPADST